MTNDIEFIVEFWEMGGTGRFTVFGRCGSVPIRLNDEFDAVYRYKHRRYPDEVGDEPVREVEKPASLRVVSIHAYEKSLSTMGQGMTGSLVIEGDGTQYIAAGWALGQRDPAQATVSNKPQSVSHE